jgi:hypothetical protein
MLLKYIYPYKGTTCVTLNRWLSSNGAPSNFTVSKFYLLRIKFDPMDLCEKNVHELKDFIRLQINPFLVFKEISKKSISLAKFEYYFIKKSIPLLEAFHASTFDDLSYKTSTCLETTTLEENLYEFENTIAPLLQDVELLYKVDILLKIY